MVFLHNQNHIPQANFYFVCLYCLYVFKKVDIAKCYCFLNPVAHRSVFRKGNARGFTR